VRHRIFINSEFGALRGQNVLKQREPLGNTTVNVSAFRKKRFRLLAEIKAIVRKYGMPLRVLHCMHSIPGKAIDVMRRQAGTAYVRNVIACGSVWLCPVCASRIMVCRREELNEAFRNNIHLLPVMVTVTLQHHRGDKLHVLLDALNDALRKLKAGRWWQKFEKRYGVVAHVSSLEIRFSQKTGWHPHKHILLFLDVQADELNIQAMKEELSERYTALLARSGRYASEFHSIDVSIGNEAAGSYIAKWGLCDELVKANLKESRFENDSFSPFQLADLAGIGIKWAERAFIEYARVTYRKKQITWAHHSRQKLGIGSDKSDEQLAQETEMPDDELIVSLSREEWAQVLRHGVIAELLDVAEAGGAPEVLAFIAGLSPPGG
jgi:hypothetical protein